MSLISFALQEFLVVDLLYQALLVEGNTGRQCAVFISLAVLFSALFVCFLFCPLFPMAFLSLNSCNKHCDTRLCLSIGSVCCASQFNNGFNTRESRCSTADAEGLSTTSHFGHLGLAAHDCAPLPGLRELDLLRCLDDDIDSSCFHGNSDTSTSSVDCTLSIALPSSSSSPSCSSVSVSATETMYRSSNRTKKLKLSQTIGPLWQDRLSFASSFLVSEAQPTTVPAFLSFGAGGLTLSMMNPSHASMASKVRCSTLPAKIARKRRRSNSAAALATNLVVARECSRCHTTTTPLWRNGPNGSLCNACGIRYRKEERRAASAIAVASSKIQNK